MVPSLPQGRGIAKTDHCQITIGPLGWKRTSIEGVQGTRRRPPKKLFRFLNEIGARALRIQLGRVLEMAESSNDRYAYANKIAARFGGQQELELVVPTPPLTPTVRQVTADELPLFAQLGAPGNEAAN